MEKKTGMKTTTMNDGIKAIILYIAFLIAWYLIYTYAQ